MQIRQLMELLLSHFLWVVITCAEEQKLLLTVLLSVKLWVSFKNVGVKV